MLIPDFFQVTTITYTTEWIICPIFIQYFIGDGICDDDGNIAACGYDQGDCCDKSALQLCIECKCLRELPICPTYFWVADGQCDEFNNNEKCLFDGGDCEYTTWAWTGPGQGPVWVGKKSSRF